VPKRNHSLPRALLIGTFFGALACTNGGTGPGAAGSGGASGAAPAGGTGGAGASGAAGAESPSGAAGATGGGGAAGAAEISGTAATPGGAAGAGTSGAGGSPGSSGAPGGSGGGPGGSGGGPGGSGGAPSGSGGGAGGAGGSVTTGGTYKSRYALTVKGTQTLINGVAFLVKGFRMSNSAVNDQATNNLIAELDTYKASGLNTISIFFQGSRYTKVVGYLPDASLDPVIAGRIGRVIEAADARGMIVLVGCLYYGGAGSTQPNWTQTDADNAIANTTRWAANHNYKNVFFDPDNEGMAGGTFSDPMLVQAGKTGNPNAIMGSPKGACAPAADVCIHLSQKDPAKPYIQSEGIAQGWAYGTGNYQAPVGIFTASQEQSGIGSAQSAYTAGEGWMLASTWEQAAPTLGPNANLGGDGINMPGVAWWANAMQKTYGAWVPPAPLP
jgi:hypothetical protein